jgi:RNA polymerase sigma-70 factor (ECF subfamily)
MHHILIPKPTWLFIPVFNLPGIFSLRPGKIKGNSLLSISSTYHMSREEILAEIEQVVKAQEDPRQFAPIYNRYFDPIFIYVYKRIDDEELTAEITSRVFYNCLHNLKRFKYQGVPFSAWLYRIAINEINSFFRNKSHQTRVVTLSETHIETIIDELDRNEPEIDKYVLVSTLLEQLTPDEIQFVELRFFENKPFKEIGYLLGISEGNAKIKTYRILEKLRGISKQITYTEV